MIWLAQIELAFFSFATMYRSPLEIHPPSYLIVFGVIFPHSMKLTSHLHLVWRFIF
jgi:hypothetical protein